MQIGDAATYLMGMAVKNGFYHPKKIYTIFYQDKYRDEGGQVGDVKILLDKGSSKFFVSSSGNFIL